MTTANDTDIINTNDNDTTNTLYDKLFNYCDSTEDFVLLRSVDKVDICEFIYFDIMMRSMFLTLSGVIDDEVVAVGFPAELGENNMFRKMLKEEYVLLYVSLKYDISIKFNTIEREYLMLHFLYVMEIVLEGNELADYTYYLNPCEREELRDYLKDIHISFTEHVSCDFERCSVHRFDGFNFERFFCDSSEEKGGSDLFSVEATKPFTDFIRRDRECCYGETVCEENVNTSNNSEYSEEKCCT